MDEKSLYAQIINLSTPWQVKSLSLVENVASVTVTDALLRVKSLFGYC